MKTFERLADERLEVSLGVGEAPPPPLFFSNSSDQN